MCWETVSQTCNADSSSRYSTKNKRFRGCWRIGVCQNARDWNYFLSIKVHCVSGVLSYFEFSLKGLPHISSEKLFEYAHSSKLQCQILKYVHIDLLILNDSLFQRNRSAALACSLNSLVFRTAAKLLRLITRL